MKKYTIVDEFKNLNISMGSNFEEWFSPMPFDKKAKTAKLYPMKLPREMNDFEIQEKLKPTEVSIEEIVETIKGMDKSTWALFNAKDKDGVLRSVSVFWGIVGWRAHPHALDDRRWRGVDQVFSRNSCSDSLTPSSLKTQEIADTQARLSELKSLKETMENKKSRAKHYWITVIEDRIKEIEGQNKIKCMRCNDNGCPACDGTKGDKHNPEPY
jgi:hypothetical protein